MQARQSRSEQVSCLGLGGGLVPPPTPVLLPDWEAITQIIIGTVSGTRLASREASIKMELHCCGRLV